MSVLAAALIAAPAFAQTPSFPAGTELVTVDAVVHGKDGEPILGLTAADFTVLEGGVPQEIVAFEAVNRPSRSVTTALSAAAPPRSSSNVDAAARTARTFVIVFDERHLDLAEAVRGRKALAQFLTTGVGDGDRVTLAGTQSGATWTARLPEGREALLKVLDTLQGRRLGDLVRDAISDWEAMRIDRETDWIVIDRVTRRLVATNFIRRDAVLPRDQTNDGTSNLETERGMTRARAAQVYAKATLDNEATLSVIERAMGGLAAGRGRKSLILVSGGFIQDSHIDAYRRVVTAARRANVALYFVDARGISAASAMLQADSGTTLEFNDLGASLAEARNDSEGSDGLALDTGGFTVRDNDLAGGLERINRESTSYYLLGYKPTESKADGRFHKIEVKVARPGVRIGARRGYYAPDAAAKRPEARDAGIQRALDSPFELPDVPLRATTHVFGESAPGKLDVAVTAEADVRGFDFKDSGGSARDTLELMLVVTNRDTAEFFRFDQQFEMNLKPETRARYEKTWFPIPRKLELVPGPYQARIIVRDKNDGRVGSLTHDFEVPAAAGLRISTPILSDRLREAGDARVPEPTARREFPPAGVLHCRFEVYGAAKDKATGASNVTAGFSIRRSDGRFLTVTPETPLRPGPDGSLSRTFGAGIEGAPPGRYEMVIFVTDVAAGQVAEIREPFTIEAPATP